MRVKVLLFGPEEKRVGRPFVEVEISKGETADQVLRRIREEWPQLGGAGGGGLRLAVNHAFAAGDEKIGAGDELALIGMVSGG